MLTEPALDFVDALEREFGPRIETLLQARRSRAAEFREGKLPSFDPKTAEVRDVEWTVSPPPPAITDRRVEITGPVDRKMIINALNSGANVFMADFEDSSAPTWENMTLGQANLRDAVERTIRFEDSKRNKTYTLSDKPAILFVRPRGLHLPEDHYRLEGRPIHGCLMDFGLFMFHCAKTLEARGHGPFFYLPKLESHHEAQLWDDVITLAEQKLGLQHGSVRATVLIETLPAAFEMDEILYALREHSAGLNCGRWDYIFSFIKVTQAEPGFVLPDRGQVTMDKGFLRAYSERLVGVCHRRGAHAMGGMAAQIPIRGDEAANTAALEKVRRDKEREVLAGHDGTWVAHPGLIPVAREVFDEHMPNANQISKPGSLSVSRESLLEVVEGTKTLAGLEHNIRVGMLYLQAWIDGRGCVPIDNLMEDAATAEISRTQVWQWRRHAVVLSRPDADEGVLVDDALIQKTVAKTLTDLQSELSDDPYAPRRLQQAADLFIELCCSDELTDFLTLAAYPLLKQPPETNFQTHTEGATL